jgi:hypothetical protein
MQVWSVDDGVVIKDGRWMMGVWLVKEGIHS